jgi:uncharacterized membrane protein YbhN (UPF0104 family)
MKYRSALDQVNGLSLGPEGDESRVRTNKRRLRLLLGIKILLTVGVLGLLVFTIEPEEILRAVRGARYPLVWAALALVLPSLGLRALKWGYLLKQVKPEARAVEILNTLLVGFTFAVVTPGQVGEFGRAFFISGRPRLELIGLSFIDKLYNLLAIVLCGSLALLFLPGLVLGRNTYLFFACCLLVAVLWAALTVVVLSPRWMRDLLYAINVMLPYRDKVKVLLSGLDPIWRRQSVILALLGIAHYLVSIVQFYLLVLSFQPAGFFDSFVASAATIFVKAALPISIGGLGVGETASVAFYQLFGVGQAAAFNSSVMLFSMNVVLPALVGLLILIKLRIVPENASP